MADKQPPTVVQGAVGDVDDERPAVAQSAQDRQAASALASLDDASKDTHGSAATIDRAAADQAVRNLAAAKPSTPADAADRKTGAATTANVKVDAAHVALLVNQLELPRSKAIELLKQHQGDAVLAMRAFLIC